MPVGFANGTPFKIPLTSSVGSSGAAGGSSGTSGATAASAPAGDSGAASQLVVTKTYVGGDDDNSVVFHNFTSGSSEVPASSMHVVDTAPFGANASVFNAHSTDTLVNAPWDGHFLVVSSDWDL